jgi:predicted dithiol-disulfide oxidoreductase (DUF899 family)
MAKAKRKSAAKRKSTSRRRLAAKTLHKTRYPNESPSYRAARERLLEAEMELRKKVEAVAALRRKLPLGGAVPEDYEFEEGAADLDDTQTVRRVRMSELFGRDGSLIVYNYMYGPAMAKACPMCTSMLDSLNGAARHAGQRVGIAVVAKSPIQRIREIARERGWRHLRLLSSAGNSYNRDYHGEDEDGDQNPSLNVFTRDGDAIRHTWGSELMFAPTEPGQHPRHIDMMWPLWNLFDLTREGRGKDWYPKLAYGE